MMEPRYMRLVEVSRAHQGIAHNATLGIISKTGHESIALGRWVPSLLSINHTWTITVTVPLMALTSRFKLIVAPELLDGMTGNAVAMPRAVMNEEDFNVLYGATHLALTTCHMEHILVVRLLVESHDKTRQETVCVCGSHRGRLVQ